MSFNEKNSKYTSFNNYFRRKGVVSVFKTLASSKDVLFSERMRKMDELLRDAKVFLK